MFLGRSSSNSDSSESTDDRPSPRSRRGNKRRSGHSPNLHDQYKKLKPTWNERRGDTHESLVVSVPSHRDDSRVSPPLAPPAYSSLTTETWNRMNDPRASRLSLLQTLNASYPSLDSYYALTARDLMLRQQPIMGTHHAAPARAEARHLETDYSMTSTLNPNLNFYAAAGLYNPFSIPQMDAPRASFLFNANRLGPFLHEAQPSSPPNRAATTTNADNLAITQSSTGSGLSIPDHLGNNSNEEVARKSESDGLTLGIPADRKHLNENQIFLRKQLETFPATLDDLSSRTHGKNRHLQLHQVGIRCRHCSHLPVARRNKGSMYFPSTLMGIYQAAQNISVEHIQSGFCPALSSDVKDRFDRFAPRRMLSSGGGKKYWANAAERLGLVDTDNGIRFAADVLPVAESEIGKPIDGER